LIAEGVTQQKEIAARLDVDPATIFRDSEELVRRGEIIKNPKTGALSLPDGKAPLAEGTEGSTNDDDESVDEW
jgi:Mn-dependent DtxR family transcriptional regulator